MKNKLYLLGSYNLGQTIPIQSLAEQPCCIQFRAAAEAVAVVCDITKDESVEAAVAAAEQRSEGPQYQGPPANLAQPAFFEG